MTGIFDKNCYKLFGMNAPKQKITNKSTNEIIEKVRNIQTGLSEKCLESFGVQSQKRKEYVIQKKKVGNKNENKNKNKNTFFDFLYLYKKYHLQNEIKVLNNGNDFSIKIQMIDNEEEIFIPVEIFNIGNGRRFMFKYNDSSYFIRNNNNNIGYNIRFLYEGCLIHINETLLVSQINHIEDIHGIPKYPSRYIPIISTLKIPNKLLHSVLNEVFPNDHIPLYFSIINRKFFIRYWNTNLYIDKGNFFILIQNKPLYFNEKIDNIINPNKDKEYTVGKNILDIYYYYPFKGMENKIEVVSLGTKLTIKNQSSLRSYNYNQYKKFIKLGLDSVTYLKKKNNTNEFCIRFNEQSSGMGGVLSNPLSIIVEDKDITIDEFFKVIYPENLNSRTTIDIQNYNSIFKISEILSLLLPPVNNTDIYFDVLEDLFFIDFYGMNLYFQKNTKNYIIFIQNDIYIFNENLILQDIFQKDSYPVEDGPFTENGVTFNPDVTYIRNASKVITTPARSIRTRVGRIETPGMLSNVSSPGTERYRNSGASLVSPARDSYTEYI
jgi:hypothetical protein